MKQAQRTTPSDATDYLFAPGAMDTPVLEGTGNRIAWLNQPFQSDKIPTGRT